MTAQQPRLSSSSPRRHPRLREPKHPTTHLLDLSYLSQFPQRSLVVHSVSEIMQLQPLSSCLALLLKVLQIQ
ncbi:hypothetical protein C1H46_001840 [Malus baccata]|uniref:Uncharacterized protein n=1 Tax=Malus baccata TaxID=106549 RepID=A0A540NNL2_MALBA|nr:hypothetical protein C1H46_001840 [Malus baccata]